MAARLDRKSGRSDRVTAGDDREYVLGIVGRKLSEICLWFSLFSDFLSELIPLPFPVVTNRKKTKGTLQKLTKIAIDSFGNS